jgi:hypothetical protein
MHFSPGRSSDSRRQDREVPRVTTRGAIDRPPPEEEVEETTGSASLGLARELSGRRERALV